jgi:dual specificity protein kinase YAK1
VLLGSFKPDKSPAYNQSIDMWSLGCTAIELFIKTPIFPGKHDYDQMLKIVEFCGMPPMDMIYNSVNRDKFFYYDQHQNTFHLKTFQQFLMTSVEPQHRGNVDVP